MRVALFSSSFFFFFLIITTSLVTRHITHFHAHTHTYICIHSFVYFFCFLWHSNISLLNLLSCIPNFQSFTHYFQHTSVQWTLVPSLQQPTDKISPRSSCIVCFRGTVLINLNSLCAFSWPHGSHHLQLAGRQEEESRLLLSGVRVAQGGVFGEAPSWHWAHQGVGLRHHCWLGRSAGGAWRTDDVEGEGAVCAQSHPRYFRREA